MFTTSRLTIFASFFLGALTVAMGALLLVRSGYDRVALLPTADESAAPPPLAVGMSWYLGAGSPYTARPEPRFGAVFQQGDLYLNKDNYELWEHNGAHWGGGPVAALSLREGPMGPAGPVGPPGPAGSRGPQGLVGPAGPPGRDGVGSDGGGGFLTPTEVGSESSGGDGRDGVGGPPGLLPPAAVQPEFEGSEPDPAPPAPQGVAAGPAGPVGPAGPPGPQGAVGPVGPEGPAGPRGRRGPAGQDGAGVDGDALRELVAEEMAETVDTAVSEALTVALADLPGELTDLIDERIQDKVGPAGPAGPAGPPGERGPRGRRGYDGADGADGGPRFQVFYFTGALVENDQQGQNDGDILFLAKAATSQSPRLLCGIYLWRNGQWGSYDAHGTWHNGRAIGNANSCGS